MSRAKPLQMEYNGTKRVFLIVCILSVMAVLLKFGSLHRESFQNGQIKFKVPFLTKEIASRTLVKPCGNLTVPCAYLLKKKETYNLGDIIQVGIVLREGQLEGQDEADFLLVWMRDQRNGAASAGYVEYLGQGKYLATLRALWEGKGRIHVMVRGTAEGLNTLNKILHQDLVSRRYSCVFQYGKYKESTRAYLVLKHGQYSERKYCNLTTENYGYELYCLRPTKKELQCTDWTQVSNTESRPPVDKKIRSELKSGITPWMINTTIQVQVSGRGKRLFRSPVPCDRSVFAKTWSSTSPVGFYYNNTWYPTLCDANVSKDDKKLHKCLSNRSVRVFGDSTVRQLYKKLLEMVPTKLLTQSLSVGYGNHRPSKSVSDVLNLTIYWGLHGLPLQYQTFYRGVTRPIHVNLDLISSDSRDMILICIFLHFVRENPKIFRAHLRRIVTSVKALLRRSPAVKIAIKAPHSIIGSRLHTVRGMVGYLYRDMIMEEFKELPEKVIFLDSFDLSVAMGNKDDHPNQVIIRAMVDQFLEYSCIES